MGETNGTYQTGTTIDRPQSVDRMERIEHGELMQHIEQLKVIGVTDQLKDKSNAEQFFRTYTGDRTNQTEKTGGTSVAGRTKRTYRKGNN